METTADIVEGMAGVTVKTPPNLSIINKISRLSLIQTVAYIGIKLKLLSGNPKTPESYDRTQPQIDYTKVDNMNNIKMLNDENYIQK